MSIRPDLSRLTRPGAAVAAAGPAAESAVHAASAEAQAPWMLLCPPGTVQVPAARAPAVVPTYAPGTSVALTSDRPFNRGRLRRVAHRAGLSIERELLVLPSLDHPILVVDDVEPAVRHLWSSLATVPPGLVLTAVPAAAALRMARALPWSWTGAAAPGRVVLGSVR